MQKLELLFTHTLNLIYYSFYFQFDSIAKIKTHGRFVYTLATYVRVGKEYLF